MRLFNKVVIIGTGLIGGSLALAMKKRGLTKRIIGMGRHRKNLLLAKKIGAIDFISQDFSLVRDADLVVLATPVRKIIELGLKISPYLNAGCIVIDVGSTKGQIVKSLEKTIPCFVGSHPLSGSEKRSVIYANPDMFQNSLCILTPTPKTNLDAFKKIKQLWEKVGAKVVTITPSMHDKILAFTSHLPHILSFSLICTVPEAYFQFSSGGLRDTTRVASSDSELWTDIFLSNARNAISAIVKFQKKLSALTMAIRKKDRQRLSILLKKAKTKRDKLV
ncbi:MAG: prephenate dehydrogenase [Candidatus Omnitrophica bacterium]|nr:prephenate dehydrogenase [Candidatus Omnitrophota bacterium]